MCEVGVIVTVQLWLLLTAICRERYAATRDACGCAHVPHTAAGSAAHHNLRQRTATGLYLMSS